MSGKIPAAADKSKFMQTCNRLSLFMKEKGYILDLNHAKLNATGALESATVDLLSNIDDEAAGEKPSLNINLPRYFVLDSSSLEVKNCTNKATSSKAKTAQMTIFYGGQVVVLDDVPEDRTRDLILMAKNIQPKMKKHVQVSKSPPCKAPAAAKDKDLESDLPIARRASLHKFLAKRKDRRAPYQPQGKEHSFDLNM